MQAAHRFLRVLSKRLGAAGLSAMRFDYYGSGDSYGDERELTVETMIADARTAVAELSEARGLDEICLIGYRMGAVPAVAAARDGAHDVVLLDPVLDASTWLSLAESSPWFARLDDGGLESGGFVMGRQLHESLRTRATLIEPLDGPEVAAVVLSSEIDAAAWPAEKVTVVPSDPTWTLNDGFGSVAIAPALIDSVVERVERRGRARV